MIMNMEKNKKKELTKEEQERIKKREDDLMSKKTFLLEAKIHEDRQRLIEQIKPKIEFKVESKLHEQTTAQLVK